MRRLCRSRKKRIIEGPIICRSIYHDAKLLIQDHVGWFARQKRLGQICDHINRKHMQYPNTRYCKLVTLPVRLRLTPVIDAIAWRLTR